MTDRIPMTVVGPVFDRHNELRRALQSVARQSLAEFECIVVDDGSPEPLAGVVSEFDERFVFVRSQRNLG